MLSVNASTVLHFICVWDHCAACCLCKLLSLWPSSFESLVRSFVSFESLYRKRTWQCSVVGCCGGCGSPPGIPVPACRAEEYPQRMCNVTRWFRQWRRPFDDADAAGGRRGRWRDPYWPRWYPDRVF